MRAPLTFPIDFPPASCRALDGGLEMSVADSLRRPRTRPERVTAVLVAVYECIADKAVDAGLVRSLAIATREWLLQRVADRFAPEQRWFQSRCRHCGDVFDIAFDIADAGKKPAAASFPVAAVATSLGTHRFEAPNGFHEEAVANQPAAADPRRLLAGLCCLTMDGAAAGERFSDDDIDRIDVALETISPEIAAEVQTVCPACGARTEANIEPLDYAFPDLADLLLEAHLLAGAYHWSETQILALPAWRRSSYADLVLRDRGRAARAAAAGSPR